jgi:hypothetical protein
MLLKEFMTINKIIATSTFFEKSNHNTWSWQGNAQTEHQIDHILMIKEDLRKVINVQTEGAVLSDHEALNATIKLAKYIPKKKTNYQNKCTENEETNEQTQKRKKRIDWSLIPQEAQKFNTELEKQLTVDTNYKNFTDAITNAAIQIAEDNGTRKQPTWFVKAEEKLTQLIERRNKAIKEQEKSPTEENKMKIQQARRELKKGKEDAKTLWLKEKSKKLKV